MSFYLPTGPNGQIGPAFNTYTEGMLWVIRNRFLTGPDDAHLWSCKQIPAALPEIRAADGMVISPATDSAAGRQLAESYAQSDHFTGD